ncbi:hypothetical protein FHX52_1486 [Humibacillus xanthopallidus]|uniref:Excreted virulence factor EspC (Type VII ESX diderm) n=1 Tax=Humibacillus xanthopallidus TaxID=412689 RepID=A0A543PWC5_9MICO|nr:hypothetical protein [Humibacillus xanthopallidus]TQN48355.1 hypothetical protein FHX52_1486 [Humibacillus xanthopallidus]
MQFRVETDGLRESAAAIEEVLARLERVRVADELAPVGSAFRGGESATASGRACAAWNARLSGLRSRVRATGAALDVAAAGYDAVEQVARRALTVPGPQAPTAPGSAAT